VAVGMGHSESLASPNIAHQPYFRNQLFSLKAPNGIPILRSFLVGLIHCGLWHEKVNGWRWEGGQSESLASPTSVHRSNFGVQLFSLKAPNWIPILSEIVGWGCPAVALKSRRVQCLAHHCTSALLRNPTFFA
jgi:hypothetical protein